jgi:hypothetical protein
MCPLLALGAAGLARPWWRWPQRPVMAQSSLGWPWRPEEQPAAASAAAGVALGSSSTRTLPPANVFLLPPCAPLPLFHFLLPRLRRAAALQASIFSLVCPPFYDCAGLACSGPTRSCVTHEPTASSCVCVCVFRPATCACTAFVPPPSRKRTRILVLPSRRQQGLWQPGRSGLCQRSQLLRSSRAPCAPQQL